MCRDFQVSFMERNYTLSAKNMLSCNRYTQHTACYYTARQPQKNVPHTHSIPRITTPHDIYFSHDRRAQHDSRKKNVSRTQRDTHIVLRAVRTTPGITHSVSRAKTPGKSPAVSARYIQRPVYYSRTPGQPQKKMCPAHNETHTIFTLSEQRREYCLRYREPELRENHQQYQHHHRRQEIRKRTLEAVLYRRTAD